MIDLEPERFIVLPIGMDCRPAGSVAPWDRVEPNIGGMEDLRELFSGVQNQTNMFYDPRAVQGPGHSLSGVLGAGSVFVNTWREQ